MNRAHHLFALQLFPPTCRAQQKVAEMRGADPAGLRRAIDQQLALLGPSAGGASSSSSGGGMSAAGMAMCNALAQVGRLLHAHMLLVAASAR